MIAARRTIFFFAALSLIALAGCKTTPKKEKVPPAPPPLPTEFTPATALSPIHMDSGRYANLFAPSSYAVWVSDAVANTKLQMEKNSNAPIDESLMRDAQTVARNYFVIEVNLDSIFPDASIAYDVVGLRSIDVYLTLPDGRRVFPVQRVLGAAARDQQEGTLHRYGRTNIIVFPKIDVISNTPTVTNGLPGLQLTLDGFNSIFHFEWASAVSGPSPAVPEKEAGGLTWSAIFTKLRELSRLTQ